MQELTVARKVNKVWTSQPTTEGAGVHLRRVFGNREVPQLDPFLLMDDFRSENPDDYKRGFPWHPHRGIETITYMLEGDVEHGDSMGNRGVISSGDVQWMTAGSGIIHQEMPKGDSKGRMFGFQLWANLPASHKMMDPRYQELKAASIPEVKTPDGAIVRVVAGQVGDVRGPVEHVVIDPEYLDVTLPAGKSFTHSIPQDHTVFAYVIDGRGQFGAERPIGEHEFVLYGPGDGVVVTTHGQGVRFLLISGKPLREPVAWYGPIVMNSNSELKTAFREFEEGTFVKHPKD